jgi:hypothetical protein
MDVDLTDRGGYGALACGIRKVLGCDAVVFGLVHTYDQGAA